MTTLSYHCRCGATETLAPDAIDECCVAAEMAKANAALATAAGIPPDVVSKPKSSLYPCECGKTMFRSPGTMGTCCMEAARKRRVAAAEAEGAVAPQPVYACVCGEFWSTVPGPAVLACCLRNGYSLASGGGILHVPPELDAAIAAEHYVHAEPIGYGEIIGLDAATGEPIYGPPTLPVSPDILSPDLDTKGTPMTDTATPDTVAAPATMRITRDGFTTDYTARDATANELLLDRCSYNPTLAPFVQKARKTEATNVLGLYLEAVAFTSAGKPFNHLRFFVVGPHIYVYNRANGDTRANWKMRTEPTLLAALQLVQAALDKPSVKLFGHPVLVELTADDLSAIESGSLPPARFRGTYRIERDYGRYDFEMEVRSTPVPPKLIKTLTAPPFASVLPE